MLKFFRFNNKFVLELFGFSSAFTYIILSFVSISLGFVQEYSFLDLSFRMLIVSLTINYFLLPLFNVITNVLFLPEPNKKEIKLQSNSADIDKNKNSLRNELMFTKENYKEPEKEMVL